MSWDCSNCERANVDRAKTCVHCSEPRPDTKRASETDTCERCGTVSKSVAAFHPDDEEARSEDRGRRLCGGCWIPALKRRATCDHEWARGKRDGEKCAACEGIVSDLRQQFREYGDKIEARSLHL